MARIIENEKGRRLIKITTNDVISIIRDYQQIVKDERDYEKIRKLLDKSHIFLAEEDFVIT